MQRNQISLNKKSIEENRQFLRLLYETDELEQANKQFDKLDCRVSFFREHDPDMTLDAYLDLMDGSFHMILQLGAEFQDQIRYGSRGSNDKGIDIFAWVECPFNEYNYSVVSRLFKEVSTIAPSE